MLEHHPHLLTMMVDIRFWIGDIHIIHIDVPGRRSLQTVQTPQQRGLTRTGGPNDNHNLSLMDLQRHTVQRLDLSILKVHLDIFYTNQRISAHCFSASSPVYPSTK